jgi:hypothetical protein
LGTIYLAALVLGLGMILVQLLMSAGSDAADGSAEGVHDTDDSALVHDAAHPGGFRFALVFRLRFWTFALMAFGLLGTFLHFIAQLPRWGTLGAALAIGLLSGAVAVWTFAKLSEKGSNSGAESSELLGQLGRVLLPSTQAGVTKVRLRVRGQVVDYIATSDDVGLQPGVSVLVEEVRGDRVHVSAAPAGLKFTDEE